MTYDLKAMIEESQFKPLWWLKSRHLQTLWPLLAKLSRRPVPLSREILELPDGDFLELDWLNAQSNTSPLVLFLHGLGGNSRSPHIQCLLHELKVLDWQAVVMHYRGCGGRQNRLARIYHSGDTADVAYIAKILKQRYPSRPLFAIGFSMGGNILLKWLGETGAQNPLRCACAVSVPFDLDKIATHIPRSFGGMYERWFMRHLKRTVKDKFADSESPVDLAGLRKCRHMHDFDSLVTAPLHGFKDADDYYQQASCRSFLADITVPTLILHAADDPLMPDNAYPSTAELSASTTLELSRGGGHLGFVTSRQGLPQLWLTGRLLQCLQQAADTAE